MDSVAVDHDRDAFLSSSLAKALYEDEHSRRLCVKEASFMTNHDMVEHDVNVGNLVRMERSDESVGHRCLITTLDEQL